MATFRLELPENWVRADAMERALLRAGEPHAIAYDSALFLLPVGCKVMIDAGTRLLSLANQLAHRGRQVTLEFVEGEDGVMGYLNRLGFFDLLHPSIKTIPDPPAESTYKGSNPSVVEFLPISPLEQDRSIPQRLEHALEGACRGRTDISTLGHAAYTVFAELIDNIFVHSETEVDGYAALQVYPRGGRVLVAVSDSGRGILATIRPALQDTPLELLSDPELIVHMFNTGISRDGAECGCGLHRCAENALKYRAKLFLRLPTSSLHLVPGGGVYRRRDMAYYQTDLPLLHGTHIAFEFQLDS